MVNSQDDIKIDQETRLGACIQWTLDRINGTYRTPECQHYIKVFHELIEPKILFWTNFHFSLEWVRDERLRQRTINDVLQAIRSRPLITKEDEPREVMVKLHRVFIECWLDNIRKDRHEIYVQHICRVFFRRQASAGMPQHDATDSEIQRDMNACFENLEHSKRQFIKGIWAGERIRVLAEKHQVPAAEATYYLIKIAKQLHGCLSKKNYQEHILGNQSSRRDEPVEDGAI